MAIISFYITKLISEDDRGATFPAGCKSARGAPERSSDFVEGRSTIAHIEGWPASYRPGVDKSFRWEETT
ncbi:hypothetical protein ROS1_40310 [Roseibium sp. ROS1]